MLHNWSIYEQLLHRDEHTTMRETKKAPEIRRGGIRCLDMLLVITLLYRSGKIKPYGHADVSSGGVPEPNGPEDTASAMRPREVNKEDQG